MKIPVIWFKNKSEDEKKSVEYILQNNKILVQALLDIIDQFEQEEDVSGLKLTDYDSPSWSHKQADRNGARRALRKVRTLFSFQQETTS